VITRSFILKICRGLCAAFAVTAVAAQVPAYPDKPIRLIVPYPPGGSTDVLARMLGERISSRLGQPVLVENRAGASGNIGASFVAKSPADGYTIFLGTSTALAVNPGLYKTSLPYDPVKDFAPIILATRLPSILVVPEASPFKTIKDLNDYLKVGGEKITYASSGNGTPAHLGGELYKKIIGARSVHVPYKGGIPALTDLISGQTDYMIAILPETMPFVKGGKLRALAVTTTARLPGYPQLPTMAESGVPGYELVGWYAFLAPAATPQPVLDKLNLAFNAALKDKDINDKLVDMGFEIAGGPPSALGELMRSETVKWRKVIDDSNIKLD
jgi:tripartite-type tricarboxylate transporter receptor subunit TctC